MHFAKLTIMLAFACGVLSAQENQFLRFDCGPEKSKGACRVQEDPSKSSLTLISKPARAVDTKRRIYECLKDEYTTIYCCPPNVVINKSTILPDIGCDVAAH
ncbi:hypothetical protein PGTUg99_019119 [Puccinia graminis f. sp. tritici]|uniref:CLIP domain-containing serine protease n=2 Tax=Puccinia graminis f. sp. tritici TaxID=56615 RepID=E3KWB7_PUCGT|nr:uncharacterized protein PGTG_14797 [Puccinia graminis f. sp. tritici CRL 75-36-700-3]XP_003333015.1 uncharacterized protein PGTG_14801 [Puccinia graminis f. sp. tritici CRL 75-36-700-3]EFP88592.1 hypothetical protein PGTG_14797 [Puccinia graminis f. sp. tritici CRL 75-36-700-3]EFP88596.1 hypothetical protein PGTG_14801 [Puccinia graminis f. sp. tritici CRL 75-36-700-3]KAA1138835.1 hypothetical protein PGTUg99_019119 [Puccinia graminis f. sp. tritici]